MIVFSAVYFDGRTSTAHDVTVRCDGIRLSIRGPSLEGDLRLMLAAVNITAPVGRRRRNLSLPGGGMLETRDLEAVDRLEKLSGQNIGMRGVAVLERHWRLAIMCLAGLVLAAWGVSMYGIPLLAKQASKAIPASVMRPLGEKTLEILDSRFLSPSKLDEPIRNRLTGINNNLCRELEVHGPCEVVFRESPVFGANAFALPSGTVIMTDEMVALAENDLELTGVMVHELAHIKYRHAARSILQDTGVFLLISILVGDVASITSTAAALPTVLIESGYSRDFEREADTAAGRYLIRTGAGTAPYREMLTRLIKDKTDVPGFSFLSTHPETLERIERLTQLENSP